MRLAFFQLFWRYCGLCRLYFAAGQYSVYLWLGFGLLQILQGGCSEGRRSPTPSPQAVLSGGILICALSPNWYLQIFICGLVCDPGHQGFRSRTAVLVHSAPTCLFILGLRFFFKVFKSFSVYLFCGWVEKAAMP